MVYPSAVVKVVVVKDYVSSGGESDAVVTGSSVYYVNNGTVASD